MNRVATMPLQRLVAAGLQRAQGQLATSQQQLATGKKANDFASLGTDGTRILSAHAVAARHESYQATANRLETTLSIYDAQIGGMDTAMSDLKTQLLGAIGTGRSAGLQNAIETAFGQVRAALNSSVDGMPLFGGAQTDGDAFRAATLADAGSMTPDQAFANDDVRARARVADGIDITYGITAREAAEGILSAFATLAQAAPIGEAPTDAQRTALETAVGRIQDGLARLRDVGGDNGRRQSQVETLATRAGQRAQLLRNVIGEAEDADLGQVAIDLSRNKTIMEASYSVFSQLAGLNLGNYLK